MSVPGIGRQEQFASVGSTNDVVRAWLAAGEPEICLAVADEQTAGRGREGRTWTAPAGAGLLLSIGFRPSWLDAESVWRLPATVSLAMADAGERVTGLAAGSIRLKWPNDLVIDPGAGGTVQKLGGVLGETSGLGTADPIAIVGIGVNVGWQRDDFPPDLAGSMTSLSDATSGPPVEREALLDQFVAGLETRIARLATGVFDVVGWRERQLTTDRLVEIHAPDGGVRVVRATGVDDRTGALVVNDRGAEDHLFVGEIGHVRLARV
jgi:BirA family biotin operon repressor/biotin-[acetyl-CoA-carboxylase] ligase